MWSKTCKHTTGFEQDVCLAFEGVTLVTLVPTWYITRTIRNKEKRIIKMGLLSLPCGVFIVEGR